MSLLQVSCEQSTSTQLFHIQPPNCRNNNCKLQSWINMGFFTKDEEKPAPGHPPKNEPPTRIQIVFPTVKNLYLAIYVNHQIFHFKNSFMIVWWVCWTRSVVMFIMWVNSLVNGDIINNHSWMGVVLFLLLLVFGMRLSPILFKWFQGKIRILSLSQR